MASSFPAISIAKENRLEYFNTLEAYAVDGNLAPLSDMVAELTQQQLDRCLGMIGIGYGAILKYSQVSRHNFKQFFIGDRKLLLSPISRFLFVRC